MHSQLATLEEITSDVKQLPRRKNHIQRHSQVWLSGGTQTRPRKDAQPGSEDAAGAKSLRPSTPTCASIHARACLRNQVQPLRTRGPQKLEVPSGPSHPSANLQSELRNQCQHQRPRRALQSASERATWQNKGQSARTGVRWMQHPEPLESTCAQLQVLLRARAAYLRPARAQQGQPLLMHCACEQGTCLQAGSRAP
jgi:hypothetical protein